MTENTRGILIGLALALLAVASSMYLWGAMDARKCRLDHPKQAVEWGPLTGCRVKGKA